MASDRRHAAEANDWPQCYAVIPAAGRGRRMGSQHKLLLPWNSGTIIDQVLRAWTESRVDRILITVRQDDELLQAACRNHPRVETVVPNRPPEDMKQSVQFALDRLAESRPTDHDRWMLAPADLPTITTELINRVLEEAGRTSEIVIPCFDGRRGHPVSFPWKLRAEIGKLGPDEGIRQITLRHPCQLFDIADQAYPGDVDTPEDYQRRRPGGPSQ